MFTKIPVDEEGEKRRWQLAGVAVDMKIEVWDSEVAGQGLPLGDPSPIGFSSLMVLSWHLSDLDACRDRSGEA